MEPKQIYIYPIDTERNSRQYLLIFLVMIMFAIPVHAQITNPRAWAEWQETDGVILMQPNFHTNFPWTVHPLVRAEWDSTYLGLMNGLLNTEVKIYYILDTSNTLGYHSSIKDTMESLYGFDFSNPLIEIIETSRDVNDQLNKYVRDHGPMNVYKDQTDTLYHVLFRDDMEGAGRVISEHLGIPTVEISENPSGSVASDGGNYMVDGLSKAIIDGGNNAVLSDYADLFGLDDVHLLPHYLMHIDYYMKLVNEEALLVARQLPSNYIGDNEPYTFVEESAFLAEALLFVQQNAVAQYGRPFKVIPVPNPPSYPVDSLDIAYSTQFAPYTNSIIVNGSVFIPAYGDAEADHQAKEIYEEVMKGYNVVPVFCRQGATEGGGIHCLTNSVASHSPVWIRHIPFPDSLDQTTKYTVTARIASNQGISQARLFWRTEEMFSYNTTYLDLSGENIYSGKIPGQPYGTNVQYYIEATTAEGKTVRKPYVAPGAAFSFLVCESGSQAITTRKMVGKLKVYPNPVQEVLYFNLNASGFDRETRIEIIIYTISGAKVMMEDCKRNNGTISIPVKGLASGNYIYSIADEEGNFYGGIFTVGCLVD